MDVASLLEGGEQAFVFGEGGEDAQFDLRVVGGEQFPARAWDEGFADGAALFAAHGDVLEVRVVGAETAGGGLDLSVVGVYTAADGVDGLWQGIDIGALEFAELTVFEQVGDDRVLGREAGEHLFVGGVLAGLGLSWVCRRV